MTGSPWAVGIAAIALGWAGDVGACSFAALPAHEIDPAEVGIDQVPPELPPLSIVKIVRGRGPDMGPCGGAIGSCDDMGSVALLSLATDDRTPKERIGYRFSLAEGSLPSSWLSPRLNEVVDPRSPEGRIGLVWTDGSTDDQEPLAFTLEVVAVDAAGNESAPQRLRVMDPGSGGCRVAAGRGGSIPDGALLVSLAVIAAVTRGRRRGRPGETEK